MRSFIYWLCGLCEPHRVDNPSNPRPISSHPSHATATSHRHRGTGGDWTGAASTRPIRLNSNQQHPLTSCVNRAGTRAHSPILTAPLATPGHRSNAVGSDRRLSMAGQRLCCWGVCVSGMRFLLKIRTPNMLSFHHHSRRQPPPPKAAIMTYSLPFKKTQSSADSRR